MVTMAATDAHLFGIIQAIVRTPGISELPEPRRLALHVAPGVKRPSAVLRVLVDAWHTTYFRAFPDNKLAFASAGAGGTTCFAACSLPALGCFWRSQYQ